MTRGRSSWLGRYLHARRHRRRHIRPRLSIIAIIAPFQSLIYTLYPLILQASSRYRIACYHIGVKDGQFTHASHVRFDFASTGNATADYPIFAISLLLFGQPSLSAATNVIDLDISRALFENYDEDFKSLISSLKQKLEGGAIRDLSGGTSFPPAYKARLSNRTS